MQRVARGLIALWLGLMLASCPDHTPSAPPTLTPSPTILPTPTATVTPTPSPSPPPEPVQQAIASGPAGTATPPLPDATLICLRYEDTDADGEAEWLALYHRTAPISRNDAFVWDEGDLYPLEPARPKPGLPDVGLGEYPTCELDVRDVNADGTPEIAIFGHARENETLLHLYAWNGTKYRRLGRFSGDGGVRLTDEDGDLAEEVWEGYRVADAPSLVWYAIFTWDGLTYGWTSDRYDWFSLKRPHAYPTHKPEYAVVSFYLALDDRDLPGAYALLTPREGRSYETWALGYATTVKVTVGDAHIIPTASDAQNARVSAMVTAWDNEGGTIIARLWNVEWATTHTEAGWRLVEATAEKLDEWPVTYWR